MSDYFPSARVAVDDHLWRVRGLEIHRVDVAVLALGELRGGIFVFPAVMVPVVDVLAQNDQLSASDGLAFVHVADELVDGRTAGAAFGGEEFEQDGDGVGREKWRFARGKGYGDPQEEGCDASEDSKTLRDCLISSQTHSWTAHSFRPI